MKKSFSFLLILAMLLALIGCGNNKPNTSVTFYYPRNPRQSANSSVETFYATEKREHSNAQDLRHFLTTYLQGPLGDDMVSPFPENTHLVDLEILDKQITIHLSEEFSKLSGIKLTTACACLSLTAFGLTDAEKVTIISPATGKTPAVEITMSRADLVLTDTVT